MTSAPRRSGGLSYLMHNRRPDRIRDAAVLALVLFASVGSIVVDTSLADPLSAAPNQPPSWDAPFGTDSQGRDLLAVLVLGSWLDFEDWPACRRYRHRGRHWWPGLVAAYLRRSR